VSELGLETRVRVEEWMPFAQAYERILASHIGLVLFQPGIQNHVYALPHKMFDYMLAGLPVIAPAFALEVAPIIKEADCGILIDPSDPEQIANALDRLVVNAQERKRLGENGRRAVLEQYNWEAEAEKLVNMYVELAKSIKK
jgi:glycosyltransferase involved in cell wall biosynthesis